MRTCIHSYSLSFAQILLCYFTISYSSRYPASSTLDFRQKAWACCFCGQRNAACVFAYYFLLLFLLFVLYLNLLFFYFFKNYMRMSMNPHLVSPTVFWSNRIQPASRSPPRFYNHRIQHFGLLFKCFHNSPRL